MNSVYIEDELYDKLKEKAAREGKEVDDLIKEILEKGVRPIKPAGGYSARPW